MPSRVLSLVLWAYFLSHSRRVNAAMKSRFFKKWFVSGSFSSSCYTFDKRTQRRRKGLENDGYGSDGRLNCAYLLGLDFGCHGLVALDCGDGAVQHFPLLYLIFEFKFIILLKSIYN